MRVVGYLLLFFYDERQCPHLLALGKEKYNMLPRMFYRLGDADMGGRNRHSFFFLYERNDVVYANPREERALFVCLRNQRKSRSGKSPHRLPSRRFSREMFLSRFFGVKNRRPGRLFRFPTK